MLSGVFALPQRWNVSLFSNKRVFTSKFHTFSFFASFFLFFARVYYFFSPRSQENLGSGAYEIFIAEGEKKKTFLSPRFFFWGNSIWAETYDECGWDEKKAFFKTVL